MISAVKDLGLLALKESGKDVLTILTQTISQSNYPYMLIIELEGDAPYRFKRLDLEETNSGGSSKYLYRKGSSRGTNFSPTALITEAERTFQLKILDWFRMAERQSLDPAEQQMLKSIKETLEEHKDEIIASIQARIADLKQAGLTLKIGGKYLEEIAVFRKVFLQLVAAKEDSISAEDKICSVCGERKPKVSAGAPAYKFYTIDKPGFITGHFVRENSWRNFPVCSECSLALDEGKMILEQYFKFSFYGLSYYLIPKFLLGSPSPLIVRIITGEMEKDIRLNARSGQKLTNLEDDILDYLAEEQDTISLYFLFLRQQQGAERILLLIEDVLPSRLRALFKAKMEVDKVFSQHPFHLGRIRTFFAKSDNGKRDNDLDNYFMEIIDRIFKGLSVSLPFLTNHFMREIRRDFNEGKLDSPKIVDAMETLEFFTHLKMLRRKEVTMATTIFDPIFVKYGSQLDSPEKRAVFLLGALTRMLLNVQYAERKSQPFLANLMGLKMDQQRIKGLLPKVINKLQEYDRFDKGKALLAETISRLFMESSPKWHMTIDELNFYFVCGMNLYNEINLAIYGEKEEEPSNASE